MRHTKPGLIALDMDGTILSSSGELTSRTKNAIRAAAICGIPVVIATGRMYPSALPILREINITAPCVFYNGEEGWYIQIYCDDRLYVKDSSDPRSRFYESISKITPVSLGDKFWDFDVDSTKLLGIALDEENFVLMSEKTRSRFGNRVYTATSWGSFVEITHPDVNKAKGLAIIAEKLGIDRKDILAIGDGVNDIEMIAWAGHGVAMGNASDSVKDAADEITADNDNDGAAAVIERLIVMEAEL